MAFNTKFYFLLISQVSMSPHFRTPPDGAAVISNFASHWGRENTDLKDLSPSNVLARRWHHCRMWWHCIYHEENPDQILNSLHNKVGNVVICYCTLCACVYVCECVSIVLSGSFPIARKWWLDPFFVCTY